MLSTRAIFIFATIILGVFAGPVPSNPVENALEPRYKKCEYDIYSYEDKKCEGKSVFTGRFTSNMCIPFQPGYRGSVHVVPKEKRCYPNNVASFYKEFSEKYCSGGGKFTVDFDGDFCISPSDKHPYDSMDLNP